MKNIKTEKIKATIDEVTIEMPRDEKYLEIAEDVLGILRKKILGSSKEITPETEVKQTNQFTPVTEVKKLQMDYKKCPVCSKKLKRGKIRKTGDNQLLQVISCKRCGFEKEYLIEV